MTSSVPPVLTRSRNDRVIAGVCAGLAEHLAVPVRWVRIAVAALVLFGGAGALLYAWLWAMAPWGESAGLAGVGTGARVEPMRSALTKPAGSAADAAATAAEGSALMPGDDRGFVPPRDAGGAAPLVDRAMRWPIAELLLGTCLLVAGIALVLAQFGVRIRLDMVLPAMAVLVGVGLTWWQIADRERPERNMLPRVLGALALVAVGVLMFFVTAHSPSAFTVVAAAIAVLAGVALALAPWVLRINRELIAERSARAREAERSEIAAHLHDSVLQTLAAIQQRSDPGSEVARLARSQERDLREWLFRGADGAAAANREAAEVELREHAAFLETQHAVRFEVVSVGERRAVPEAIVGAAREAMLNAARHAGGDVTVYIEVTPERVSIDVTDRGAGLDLARLPEGRMGVRESIVGRMQRAGGTAQIVAGPGGTGTSVRLCTPVAPPHEETALAVSTAKAGAEGMADERSPDGRG